ncbi:MAG: rhomboid family intramembrane serine protease [Flavobacteriales bacterium]|nr:rhomboid family intramembrane serine protease [Flavobacteriales bacterium]
MMSIIDDLKHQYKTGTALIKFIFINVAVFILVHLIGLLIFFFTGVSGSSMVAYWLALPADFGQLILKPWSIITYMFLHEGFLHIAFNMIILYFGGQIFLQFLDAKKLIGTYILGGISGGLLFILTFNIFPVFNEIVSGALALGASASVMAVLIAIAAYVPNYTVRLMLLGNVKLKYIALFYVIMDIISIPQGNAGGHIAHLGGAFFGFYFIYRLRNGKDITVGVNRLLNYIAHLFSSKRKMKVVYKNPGKTKSDVAYNTQKAANQQKIDAILDKISKSGYDSLSKEEKAILFDASKK